MAQKMPITRTFIVDFGESVIKYSLLSSSLASPSAHTNTASSITPLSVLPTFTAVPNPFFKSASSKRNEKTVAIGKGGNEEDDNAIAADVALTGDDSPRPRPPISILPELITDALLQPAMASKTTPPNPQSLNALDSELKRAITASFQHHNNASSSAAMSSPLLDFHVIFLTSPLVRSFEKSAILEYLFNLTTLPMDVGSLFGMHSSATSAKAAAGGGGGGGGGDAEDDTPTAAGGRQASSSTVINIPIVVSKVHLPCPQETCLFAACEVTATVVDIGPRNASLIVPVINGCAMRCGGGFGGAAGGVIKLPFGEEDLIRLACQQYNAAPLVAGVGGGGATHSFAEVMDAFKRAVAAGGGASNNATPPASGSAPTMAAAKSSASSAAAPFADGGGVTALSDLPPILYAVDDDCGGSEADEGSRDTAGRVVVATLKPNALSAAAVCEAVLSHASLPLALRAMEPSPVVYNTFNNLTSIVNASLPSSALPSSSASLQTMAPQQQTQLFNALVAELSNAQNFKNSASVNGCMSGTILSLGATTANANNSNSNNAFQNNLIGGDGEGTKGGDAGANAGPVLFAAKTNSQSAATQNMSIPPIFLMGGGSLFPSMRSAFIRVVTKAFEGPWVGGGTSCVGEGHPIIPFEFSSPLLLLATANQGNSSNTPSAALSANVLAALGTPPTNNAAASNTNANEGGPSRTATRDQLFVAPQMRFAFPPAAVGSPGLASLTASATAASVASSSSSTTVSGATHCPRFAPHGPMASVLFAPCVGAAIASQLPSFAEGCITRREYCR